MIQDHNVWLDERYKIVQEEINNALKFRHRSGILNLLNELDWIDAQKNKPWRASVIDVIIKSKSNISDTLKGCIPIGVAENGDIYFKIKRRNQMQQQVREFMIRMGETRANEIGMRDHMHRFKLIWEESKELCDAILEEDLAKAIDGICDLLYVTFGTAEAFGVDIVQFFDEVHRTNMLKEGGGKDNWGKIRKPEGWQPPLIGVLLDQALIAEKKVTYIE